MPRSHGAPPLETLVRDACAGSTQPLQDLLLRRGGLPGPRPNLKLALAAAHALAGQGEAGRALIDRFRSLDDRAAPSGSAHPILSIVGVLGLGSIAARKDETAQRAAIVRALQDHAEDPRREVRDAVAAALGLILRTNPEETLDALSSWTDGYLHAEVALRALSEESLLQQIGDPLPALSRVQEAFALIAQAPRAHQRSQGYRSLLRTLTATLVALGRRFPHATAQWLQENVDIATEDLRAVLSEALEQLRSAGLRAGDAEAVTAALEATVEPPRDPRWDVGPTRGRGKKARKKGRRR
ncbi:MAG: hypothetical protein ACOC1F_11380 [Myxococcota bacterium]